MKKTLWIFALFSVTSLLLLFWFVGTTPELRAFTVGFVIFAANLLLWTVIVGELLESAAHTSRLLRQAAVDHSSNKLPPTEATIEAPPDCGSPEMERTDPDARRGRGLIIAGMALKVILLGGGIYVCLGVFRLSPIYFVSGMGAGLGFLAVAGYVSRQ